MKRILAVSMVFLLLAGLCGCGVRQLSQEDMRQIVKQCETVIEKYADKNGYKIIQRNNEGMGESEESDFLLQINDDWFISVSVFSEEQVYVNVNLENTAYLSDWDDYWDDDDDYWDEDDWDDDDWDDGDDTWEKEQSGDLKQRFTNYPISQMGEKEIMRVLKLYNALGRKKHTSEQIIQYVHRFDEESEVDDGVSFPLSDWYYEFFRSNDGGMTAVCLSLYDRVELSA